jgi:predicted small secreted protein
LKPNQAQNHLNNKGVNNAMKKMIAFSFLLFSFLLIACGTSSGTGSDSLVEMTGYIINLDKEGKRILVTEKFAESSKEFPDAIYFSLDEESEIVENGNTITYDHLKVGLTVKVWSTGEFKESFPMQGAAKKIEITESEVKAAMKEHQAIQIALEQFEGKDAWWIMSTEFKENEWMVQLKNLMADEPSKKVIISSPTGKVKSIEEMND